MRPKRPLVSLAKCEQQSGAQIRDFLASRTLRPQKTRTFWVRTIADMLERQDERIKSVGYAPKLLDGFRN